MTQFFSKEEVLQKTKRRDVANSMLLAQYSKQWEKDARFIEELVEHENEFALYPTSYKTVNSAYTTAASIKNRKRHQFQEGVNGLIGSFDAITVEEDGQFRVYVSYTTKQTRKKSRKRRRRNHND